MTSSDVTDVYDVIVTPKTGNGKGVIYLRVVFAKSHLVVS